MWEFVNIGHIMMGIMIAILLFGIIILEKGKSPVSILFLILLPVVIYFEAKYEYNTAKRNIELFKKGKVLYCTNITQHYNVSKKNNWKLRKNCFINDTFSIKTNRCEEY